MEAEVQLLITVSSMRDTTAPANLPENPEPGNMQWICKPFHELTPEALYQALRLRAEVFVVEQNCPYLDEDNRDQSSLHLFGWVGPLLAAYVRILPPGLAFRELSIGRVVTSPIVRRKGFGAVLMREAISRAWQAFGKQDIRIGAQYYLLDFYSSLGFRQVSEIYLEDDIEHVEMLLRA
jgi:ElaA protein